MPLPCVVLRKEGKCPHHRTGACRYDHFLKLCCVCKAVLNSRHNFRVHHQTLWHVELCFALGIGNDGICKVCDASYCEGAPSQAAYESHCASEDHLNNCEDRPNVLLPADDVPVTPIGHRYCLKCQKAIPEKQWKSHSRGSRHLRAEASRDEFYSLREKLEVEAPRNLDVTIDYGVIDPKKKTALHAVHLRLTVPGRIKLTDFRMQSASGGHVFPKEVHFEPEAWRGEIKFGETHGFMLKFDSRGVAGKFEDRIVMEFINEDDGAQFYIIKDVLAIVGNRAELQALAPKEEYKPAPVQRPENLRSVIRTPREERAGGAKFKGPLGEYPVPAVLRDILEQWTNPTELKHAFRDILPAGETSLEVSPSEPSEDNRYLRVVSELDVNTYPHLWTSLLHVEEVALQLDLTRYNMSSQPLEASGDQFMVTVPGLLEKRPSIILYDLIEVRLMNNPSGPWFEGRVQRVTQTRVYLKFDQTFARQHISRMLYEVHFKLNRTPLRRMHQGVNASLEEVRLIYPSVKHVHGHLPNISTPVWYNRDIGNNQAQQRAVLMVLRALGDSVPLLIHGPPGTGKTVAVVESVLQCLREYPNSRILICTPSNTAADLVIERLRSSLNRSEMFRLNAFSRSISGVLPHIMVYSKTSGESFTLPPLEEVEKYRVIISTCISSSLLHSVGVKRGHFERIFVDEAAQALEPESMVPVRTLAGPNTRIILSGDPLQLGPIVRSFLGREFGLERSLFERLISLPPYDVDKYTGRTIVTLSQNYRSHPAIIKFPSDLFYKGKLDACGNKETTYSLSEWSELPKKGFPIIFHAVKGEDKREGSSPSWFNPTEVLAVVEWVKKLREDGRKLGLRTDDYIGVISPYRAQCQKINSKVNSVLIKGSRPGTLKVDSVEGFQGQERRVIIISCVRSNTKFVKEDVRASLGFVANPKRFNVAITRAQALVIIVGDPVVLSLDKMWRSFMDYIHQNGGWMGTKKDWGPHAPRTMDLTNFVKARKQDSSRTPAHIQEAQLNSTDAAEFAAIEEMRAEEYPWPERE